MTPQSDIDATSNPYLRGKYAIVGVAETGYVRGSGRTTRALGTEAVRKAVEDAGLKIADVDGMLSYSNNDSTFSPTIAGEVGIRPNFYMDVYGGGSSIEALIGIAMGDRFLELSSEGRKVSAEIAIIYLGMGQSERAIDWLERAYQDHDPALLRLRRDPLFDGLRPEPRFQDLMRRLNFPE